MYYFPWIKDIDNEYVFYYKVTRKHSPENAFIVIRFSADYIRFYWRNKNHEDPTYPDNEQIFAIDLSTSQTIGNDILNIENNKIIFPENIFTPPTPGQTVPKETINKFVNDFVTELEKDDGVFASSTIVTDVHTKLQTSIIYKLIAAKRKYEAFIYKETTPVIKLRTKFNLDTDNRIVADYADLLMDAELTSILPPNKVGADCLLENPEYELQKIIDKNIEIAKERKTGQKELKKKEEWLDPNVIKKIQNFFLRKHSTISAYYTRTGKIINYITLGLMTLWSLIVIIKSLCKNFQISKNDYGFMLGLGFIIFLLFCFTVFFINKNSKSFFPRIWIALVAAWSLILFSGDFVFSYLFSEQKILFIVIIAALPVIILVVLFAVSRAQSQYYYPNSHPFSCKYWRLSEKECNWKVLPVFSFSLFLSLLMGVFLQLVTFKPLLTSGNTLIQNTFSSNFSQIENKKSSMRILISELETYKSEIIVTTVLNKPLNKAFHKHHQTQMQTKDSVEKSVFCNELKYVTDTTFLNKNPKDQIDSIAKSLNLFYSQITHLYHFTAICQNIDTLLNILTDSTFLRGSDSLIYSKFFTKNINNGDIVSFPNSYNKKPWYLFPKLLIFHSLLALLIAFIVHIIVSGKTVTEGL